VLNLLFAGTPDFAVASLNEILQSGHNVRAVLTQPDRPAGRGRKLTPSAIKTYALAKNLEILQPVTLDSGEIQSKIKKLQPDVIVVAAYGIILPKLMLTIPRYGCLNIHASLLPRWRGAAPIQRAIEAGDRQSGVSIMQMDAGLDTGDVLYEIKINISHNDTAGSLHDKLAKIGGAAICYALDNIQKLKPVPQNVALATYAKKIQKSEGLIDWTNPADKILRKIKAFNPWPIAYTSLNNVVYRVLDAKLKTKKHNYVPGTIIKVGKSGIAIATATDIILVTRLQLPGKKALEVADFVNAQPDISVGQKFS